MDMKLIRLLTIGDRIIFNGTWNGYVPMNCSIVHGSGDHRWNDNINCGLAVADMVVLPNVTWYTSEKTIPDP